MKPSNHSADGRTPGTSLAGPAPVSAPTAPAGTGQNCSSNGPSSAATAAEAVSSSAKRISVRVAVPLVRAVLAADATPVTSSAKISGMSGIWSPLSQALPTGWAISTMRASSAPPNSDRAMPHASPATSAIMILTVNDICIPPDA